MEIRYAPGESPAEVDAAFARCTAAGDLVLALAPNLDSSLVRIFSEFCRTPEVRHGVESELTFLGRLALRAGVAAYLFEHTDDALRGARAVLDGDAGLTAKIAIRVADCLDLESDAHRLVAREAHRVLREMTAGLTLADNRAASAAALDASAKALDAAADELRNATRH